MQENNAILIVEDNPGDALLLKDQLHHAGWDMTNSEHKTRLNDAIESLRNIKPAIIFLDLSLPDSNGLETFLTINSIAPGIPIVILSGLDDNSLSVQAVKAGAQDFLVKGEFEEKTLLKTILYSIERKKNQLRIEEANMRYTMAFRATNDPLWDWDMQSDEIHWNDKVRIFGYHESLRKDKYWKMGNIHVEDKERVANTLEEALKNGNDQWSCEYRFRCADGTYKYILDRGYILRDNSNSPGRMTGTMQDLTEKILLQQYIDTEKEQRQRYILKTAIDEQEKERAYISKELHENINQTLTSANLQLSLVKPGNQAKPFEAVETSRIYLKTAIDEIQKLSRDMFVSHLKDLGFLEVIEDLKDEINLLQKCKVRFIHSGSADLVPADVSLTIFRIIQEQLNNIVNHSKAGKATISLDFEENKILLHILDDGIGADPDEIKNPGGTGLLNIYNRVHAYNGNIDINTSP